MEKFYNELTPIKGISVGSTSWRKKKSDLWKEMVTVGYYLLEKLIT